MGQRRRYLTDDLLIGGALVTFFVILGIVLTAVSLAPTASRRGPVLLFGIVLGFAMLAGTLRVARFRSDASAGAKVERIVVQGPPSPPAARTNEVHLAGAARVVDDTDGAPALPPPIHA
jgi:uncharacterized protein (DUF58 family)